MPNEKTFTIEYSLIIITNKYKRKASISDSNILCILNILKLILLASSIKGSSPVVSKIAPD